MRHATLWIFGLWMFCSAGTAQAAWEQKFSGGPDDSAMGVSIHSPDGQHVFVAGMDFNVANPLTDPVYVLIRSTDGGDGFSNITGNMDLTGFMITFAQVFFADGQNGWVLLGGGGIARTTDGGESFSQIETPEGMGQVYFFDGMAGVGGGEGGALWSTVNGGTSWTSVTGPGSVQIKKFFFVDRWTGFAIGNDTHTEGEEPNEVSVADGGELLGTTDGGANWSLLWTTGGEFLSGIHFANELHGFISVVDNNEQMFLRATTSGGTSWQTVAIPTTVTGGSGKVTHIAGLMVEPGGLGQAVGVYDAGFSTSDDGQVYMLAVYTSDDGGANWRLEVNDPGDAQNPQPEGAMIDACFYSDRLAWAVGTGLRIYKNAPPCASDSDCFEGYVCEAGSCQPNTDGPCSVDGDCYADYVCRDGQCQEPGPSACTEDEDCEGALVCVHGHCTERPGCDEEAPIGSQGCPFGQICIFGRCIQDTNCSSDEQCPADQHCYEGHCVLDELPDYRCLDDTDCATGEECIDTWCEWVGLPDAGTPDASSEDAGVEDDGGATHDAGVEEDGGTTGTDHGGIGEDEGGGCACGVSGHRPAWIPWMLLLASLIFALRRRSSFRRHA